MPTPHEGMPAQQLTAPLRLPLLLGRPDRFPSAEAAAHYIAAMIDGEGSVVMRMFSTPRQKWGCLRRVEISNTDWDLIEAFCDACAQVGISRVTVRPKAARKSHWSPAWIAEILRREDFRLIREVVPLQSRRKLAKLDAILVSYRQGTEDWKRRRSESATAGWAKWRAKRAIRS